MVTDLPEVAVFGGNGHRSNVVQLLFGIENEQDKGEELQWLETYKQQLQEELKKIDEKLKKFKEGK